LKATLKINGKLVKGKVIKFKFNGKTYKAKTNKKGIVQKTLTKNVIKKLKKGKTYSVKVIYLKDTIKTTVKVR
jgi:invasion protein IalB